MPNYSGCWNCCRIRKIPKWAVAFNGIHNNVSQQSQAIDIRQHARPGDQVPIPGLQPQAVSDRPAQQAVSDGTHNPGLTFMRAKMAVSSPLIK